MSIKIHEIRNIHIGGKTIELVIQSHQRAKRLKLRCDPSHKKIYLTCPIFARKREINDFFENAQTWIEQQLAHSISRTEFKHGSNIPILGVQYLIQCQPGLTTHISLEKAVLTVKGDESRVQEVIRKWLQFHALGVLTEKSQDMAHRLGASVKNVKVRELKSLWGSCSSDGNLTYSWRLVMAPTFVLDYICAHEVSHLKERNHSSRFWSVVESLCPNYKIAKSWLRKEGRSLFLYG